MLLPRLLPFAAAGLLALCLATPAVAATPYSLAGDFSQTTNPNGVWSFTQGNVALGRFLPSTPSAVLADGYWGVGSNLAADTPWVARAAVNGAAAPPSSNNDFLAGDIIIHSTNFSAGDSVFVRWTAPAAGSIDFNASTWYAQRPLDRAVDVFVTLGSTVLGSASLNNTIGRSNAVTFAGAALPVSAGTVLSFEFRTSVGQPFGTISGLSETVLFTAAPIPEPASLAMLFSGILSLGVIARRRSGAPVARA